MRKFKLSSGLNIMVEKRSSKSVVLAMQVNIGSIHESDNNRGISHFIEHMLFEGTKTRDAHDIANEIEKVGGEINAFTSHDRTLYYVIVPKKHFPQALSIISDIIQNPKFDPESIEKERKVILDEVNLTQDDPKFYQFVFFLRNLYKSSQLKHPLYGYKETITNISKEDIMQYYSRHYVLSNMALAIIGNVNIDEKMLENAFNNLNPDEHEKISLIQEPASSSPEKFIESRSILQSYLVFGYKAPKRNSDESYAADVIRAMLARGQSSRLFNELRTKRGLCYFVGGIYEASKNYGYFAIYVGTDKSNIDEVIRIIKQELDSLKSATNDEISEAKNFIEGSFMIENEDPKKLADTLLFWNSINENSSIKNYIKGIKKVKKKGIAAMLKNYFNENHLVAIISQEK
ncbi:insulinase family protein [Candidatus Woesearchaeota archaeon]|nr:insulinase family protein [Candidatus Woesearchaeota archaeon]